MEVQRNETCAICDRILNRDVVVTVKERGLSKFVESSLKRNDGKEECFKNRVEIQLHKTCRNSYNNPKCIEAVKRRREKALENESVAAASSSADEFDFENKCIFCDTDASLTFERDQNKIPTSSRILVGQVKKVETQSTILQACTAHDDDWIQQPEMSVEQVTSEQHERAIELIKSHYLPEHVLVRARSMDLANDTALTQYLATLLRQGNTIYAKTEDGQMAGICVGFASCPVDVTSLRSYAFYRQDRNTRDFLFFTAKLQETPNLWEIFNQDKIYEIKMLAVIPEYRKLGIGTALVAHATLQAHDQGYNVVRMDCINKHDYKVAERCMFRCIMKFPLHRLRGPNAPFIKRSSPQNCSVRVYVHSKENPDSPDIRTIKRKQRELESLIE